MPKKLNQKKIKAAKNEAYALKYRKWDSEEERRAAKKAERREKVKQREAKWWAEYTKKPAA